MNNKPKRKPKNKNASIDERIKSHLYDGEEIIWRARTQKHYSGFAIHNYKNVIIGLIVFLIVLFVASLFLEPQVFSWMGTFLCTLLCVSVFFFPALLYFTNMSSRKILNYVNVITNIRVLVYDMSRDDIVHAFAYDVVKRVYVNEYGADIGNIRLDRRDGGRVRGVTSTYPFEFELKGVDDLHDVSELLRSRLDIEPEYVQSYRKAKNE